MKYWATLAQTIDSVSRSVGNAVAYAAIAMALVTTTVVILRYGFGQGAIAAQESVLYLHGALFMLGAAPRCLQTSMCGLMSFIEISRIARSTG